MQDISETVRRLLGVAETKPQEPPKTPEGTIAAHTVPLSPAVRLLFGSTSI